MRMCEQIHSMEQRTPKCVGNKLLTNNVLHMHPLIGLHLLCCTDNACDVPKVDMCTCTSTAEGCHGRASTMKIIWVLRDTLL
jgi:hypothetical protein